MDDTRTALARQLYWVDADQVPDDSGSSPNLDESTVSQPADSKSETTGEKTLDRWFLEQRGKKRVRKRLDVVNELMVTTAGPLEMTGNITLINEDDSVSHASNLKLCRCGASKNKPFCDDQHLDIEFFDNGAVTQASSCMPIKRPQNVTITCVENGPLKFNGYLRIYNKKGQESSFMQGALCRCGKSSNKPFCDNRKGCLSNC